MPVSDATNACRDHHVFNTAFEGRWGIWEAESRRLTPEDVIAMRRDYGLGIFFYRTATPDELHEYKRLGMLNIVVAHALNSPWKNHAFLQDADAVRAWVKRAVEPADVDGLAYDCESRIERPIGYDGDPVTAGMHTVLQERIAGAKNVEHVTIRGAGHFLQEDKGEDCANAMIAFIRKHA